ncbi:hypothetical protein FCM35_KLT21825 [Carex littledalei]|uniref:DUF4283 domain-containing protein n=1 Tax=Carex littledalei TaxID=544730 RepID=A0A833QG76_9POAL|nr:hypothetical protein FCM35_KLT21825 [Carex littledalei]
MSIKPPLVVLEAKPWSQAIEANLMLNFVLDDIAAWGPEKVENVLRSKFDKHRWVASVFDEYKYLIKAPNPTWLESVASRGYLRLRDLQFPVIAWDRGFSEGTPLQTVWVRIYNFPIFLDEFSEYDRVLNPFGAYVQEIDSATRNGYDVRFVRLRLAVCDIKLLPSTHLVPYRDPTGTLTKFDIDIEIENEHTEPLNAWASRKRGRPYPNGTEFGESERRDLGGPINPAPRGNSNQPPQSNTQQGGGSIRMVSLADHLLPEPPFRNDKGKGPSADESGPSSFPMSNNPHSLADLVSEAVVSVLEHMVDMGAPSVHTDIAAQIPSPNVTETGMPKPVHTGTSAQNMALPTGADTGMSKPVQTGLSA